MKVSELISPNLRIDTHNLIGYVYQYLFKAIRYYTRLVSERNPSEISPSYFWDTTLAP